MRYHLDTIPLWDAYHTEGECPLCTLRRQLETSVVEGALGGSVMESDTRKMVNDAGFCAHHYRMLYERKQRLPLALMTHTHARERIAALQSAGRSLESALASASKSSKHDLSALAASLADRLEVRQRRCHICERLDSTMERYIETLFYMYEKEQDFRDAFAASKGVCLPHYAQLLRAAPHKLSAKWRASFLSTLSDRQQKNLQRLDEELEWFTLKFDYKNIDKPWKQSQDALPRMINKLEGFTLPIEETPPE